MWVTVVAVVFVVAMLVGPIMLMQPSPQQRRLAKIRTMASKKGLHVRLGRNPASGEPKELAVYSLFETNKRLSYKPWCLARQSLEHEINFLEDWDWVSGNHAPDNIHQRIKQWLPKLPAPIRAIRVSEQSVSLYWTENSWFENAQAETSAPSCIDFIEAELYWLQKLIRT